MKITEQTKMEQLIDGRIVPNYRNLTSFDKSVKFHSNTMRWQVIICAIHISIYESLLNSSNPILIAAQCEIDSHLMARILSELIHLQLNCSVQKQFKSISIDMKASVVTDRHLNAPDSSSSLKYWLGYYQHISVRKPKNSHGWHIQ